MSNNLIIKTELKSLLFAILMLLAIPVAASSQGKVLLTLSMDDVPMEQVLKEIEKQSDYVFLNKDVDITEHVSISVVDKNVMETLDMLFNGKGIVFNIEAGHIVISRKKEADPAAGAGSADGRIVSGTVVDSFGMPIIGVGVLIKGTTTGASTDLDGKFSFSIPEGMENGVLEFACLGYSSQEHNIGNRRVFNITLKDDSIMMEATVVTALGIKRSEKALSYNVQQVDADAIMANKDANFINSLNGKVAGLNINASSSGVGGATKVIMRGMKSISQSSNALYVIDGVPMYTTAKDGGTEFASQGSSDPIADINPEDIESISVLTGAAAAALYGSDAANGAIVVTTKKGKVGKTSVSVNAGVEMMTPFMLPEFQNRYGTGDLNSSIGSIDRSWGALMNEANNPKYDPAKDYFQTGFMHTESVSLSTGTEKNQTYLSASSIDSYGIVPNNKYSRMNFTFRNTTTFLDGKMQLDLGASYIQQKDRNMTNQGTYNNPLVGAYIFPRSNDWDAVRIFERYDPTRNFATQYWPVGDAGMTMQNPYWINYRNLRENKKDRFMFNASLKYDILEWLNVVGRVRMDQSVNKYTEKFYATTLRQLTENSNNGLYGITESRDRQVYADVLVNINKRFGDDWSFQANIGASISDMSSDALKNRGPIDDSEETAGIPNVFNVQNISNSKRTKRIQEGWREQTQSVFGSAEIGYKSTYFLTVTARNDWPSQLAGPHSNKKSFFYPSIGGSVVISELIPNMPKSLEYIKLRASYASVGTAFERYIANPMFKWDESGMTWIVQTQYPMYDLKPELTNSFEVGLTMRFLRNFNMDLTYYHTNTLNQTFNPKISTGSGSSEIYIQSGDVRNQGIEFTLGYGNTWGKFGWNSNYTLSMNQNRIMSLAHNVLNAATGEYFSVNMLDMNGLGRAHFILKEGGTLGDLYSLADLRYDSNGNIYFDEDGNVTVSNIEDTEKYVKLGSVLPKANMAWRNDFSFGNFNFGFLLTARIGGVVFSKTQAVLDSYGVSEASAAARDNGGVPVNGGMDMVDPNKWYAQVGGTNPLPQYYTYSATNLRLQEASIGYTFPRKMLGDVCDLTLSIVGRNLLMIYCKAPFDPESIATTGNYYQGIDNFMMPSLRNFGFNVRLSF